MQPIISMPEEERATDIGNMHKKFGKDHARGSGDAGRPSHWALAHILVIIMM